jgi:hypothetical protein
MRRLLERLVDEVRAFVEDWRQLRRDFPVYWAEYEQYRADHRDDLI